MKNTTLNEEQIKELADYAAKRSASNSVRPGEVNKFVEEYMKEYDKAYATIKFLNKTES